MSFNYKNLTPFKWCIIENFPFIEADFDAITNYQLFCKVVEYLNKTIDSTNILGQKVEEFSKYFDNLDVQEEINNKLDEMVKTGELQILLNNIFKSINNNIENQNNRIKAIENKIDNTSYSPAGVYNTIAELQQADPNHSKIYLVKEDGKWYYWDDDIQNWNNGGVYQGTMLSINPFELFENDTGFVNNIKNICNIFNPNNYIDGKFLLSDGTFEDNNYYATTQLLPINPNSLLKIKEFDYDNIFYGFYDINKNWISRTINTLELNVPDNAYYLKVSYEKSKVREIEIYENSEIPNTRYRYTEIIRNLPLLRNIQKAKIFRGSITIKSIDRTNNTIVLKVANNTILYNGQEFQLVNAGEYIINNNSLIIFNAHTKNIESHQINNSSILQNYEGQNLLGFMSDCVVYHDNFNGLEVNKTGFLTYEKISDCLKLINIVIFNNKRIIKIAKGVYDEILECNDIIDISLIGEDAENTIIYNTNGNYQTPPIEISNGYVKNITFYSKYDGINPTENWSSYACHIDNSNSIGRKLIFENVIFKSDFNYSVGLGLYKNFDIEFNNCKFINNVDLNNDNIPTKGGCLYFHDASADENAGECSITLNNCIMISNTWNKVLRIYPINSLNIVNMNFINNSLWAKNNETQDVVQFDASLSGKNFNKTFLCHGNNINWMNK